MSKQALCITKEAYEDRNKMAISPVGFLLGGHWIADTPVLMPRSICETDSDYLQILPYVVLRKPDGSVYTYQRGAKGGESRLHSKWSIGLGGHIEEDPSLTEDQKHSVSGAVARCVLRELYEEVGIFPDCRKEDFTVNALIDYIEKTAYILYLDTDAVSKVHLGVVIVIDCDEFPVFTKEDQVIEDGRWVNFSEQLFRTTGELENWSGMLVSMGVSNVKQDFHPAKFSGRCFKFDGFATGAELFPGLPKETYDLPIFEMIGSLNSKTFLRIMQLESPMVSVSGIEYPRQVTSVSGETAEDGLAKATVFNPDPESVAQLSSYDQIEAKQQPILEMNKMKEILDVDSKEPTVVKKALCLTTEAMYAASTSTYDVVNALLCGQSNLNVLGQQYIKDKLELIDRSVCETDTKYVQIIPYVVLRNNKGEIFTYQRGKAGGENRLHDKWSIGLGGHIEEEVDPENVFGLAEVTARCILRELYEEIGLIPDIFATGFNCEAFIKYLIDGARMFYTDHDEVAARHFGLQVIIDVEEIDEMVKEKNVVENGRWVNFLNDPSEIAFEVFEGKLELWSDMLLDHCMIPSHDEADPSIFKIEKLVDPRNYIQGLTQEELDGSIAGILDMVSCDNEMILLQVIPQTDSRYGELVEALSQMENQSDAAVFQEVPEQIRSTVIELSMPDLLHAQALNFGNMEWDPTSVPTVQIQSKQWPSPDLSKVEEVFENSPQEPSEPTKAFGTGLLLS